MHGAQAARAAALSKKEKELDAKEKRLKELEAELQQAGGLKKKNWPICWPVVYHDIGEEIPDSHRRVVREMYLCWWGLFFVLWYQFFCASVMLGEKADQAVASWFLTGKLLAVRRRVRRTAALLPLFALFISLSWYAPGGRVMGFCHGPLARPLGFSFLRVGFFHSHSCFVSSSIISLYLSSLFPCPTHT